MDQALIDRVSAAIPAAVRESARSRVGLVRILARAVMVDEDTIAAVMALRLDAKTVTTKDLSNVTARFDVLDRARAAQHRVVHVRLLDGEALVTDDPLNDSAVDAAKRLLGLDVEVRPVASSLIDALIGEGNGVAPGAGRRPDGPVVAFVDASLRSAWRDAASDVHFETNRGGLVVKLRRDGVLERVADAPGLPSHEVIARIKVMAELDTAERRVPQDGRFSFEGVTGVRVDCRVSVMPSAFGEDAVIRLLDKRHLLGSEAHLSLGGLGFEDHLSQAILRVARHPHGLLLVTGPTGSGKTTTLYAALSQIRSGQEKIVTIEDPIEYELEDVIQVPVNEKKGLTFAKGLRSILRHDPDVIMVGEIRDRETGEIAVQSALTGHQVFSTVHANSALDVVSRFVHMGVDVYALAASLNGVLAQRLIRLTCSACGGHAGCERCRGTGFQGRTVVAELVILDDNLRDSIVSKTPPGVLKKQMQASSVGSVHLAVRDLVRKGLTTEDEAARVVALSQ
jgi:general secretion pathway protein E